MRTLTETRSRWQATFQHGSAIADLQRAVKFHNGPGDTTTRNRSQSPCTAGLRSLCWKAFLLWRDIPPSDTTQWLTHTRAARTSYTALSTQHLQFLRVHDPQQRAALLSAHFDPLADDPDSPWASVRRDEAVRAEIAQDVRRLPETPAWYHEPAVQAMMVDMLFLYCCKVNPGLGGYRQGMHEVLAPVLWVVAQDAVERGAVVEAAAVEAAAGRGDAGEAEELLVMGEVLDSEFVEHDAFALFVKVMESASAFYEVDNGSISETGEGQQQQQQQSNSIVERSKYIHEVALMKIDEELAVHLKTIEVLPQIFLIRWIRLLFGREFEFEQLLTLWDTLFAFDPSLELVNLICVAMLLRIRWTLLEADYSVALQSMLKYPAPPPPHGPYTFVDDALYLKDHFDAAGGVTLIFKYTGKSPANRPVSAPAAAPTPPRTSTPSFQKLNSLRQRTMSARAPLSTSARILQQPGGVEALLQGAAKNVMERGEKLGINRAVRDAVGEFRRNVQQGFQEPRSQGSRSPGKSRRSMFGEISPPFADEPPLTIALMERRNTRLAAMLDESVTELKRLATSGFVDEGGDEKGNSKNHRETVEIAAAKVQFVKACLEDSSLALPPEEEPELPAISALAISASSPTESNSAPTVALDTTPVVMTSSAVEETRTALSSPRSSSSRISVTSLPKEPPIGSSSTPLFPQSDAMDTDSHEVNDDEEEGGQDTLSPLQSELTHSPPHSIPRDILLPDVLPDVLPDSSAHPPIPIQPTTSSTSSPPLFPSSTLNTPIPTTTATTTATTTTTTTAPTRPTGPIPTRSTLAQSSFAWMLEPDTTFSSSSASSSAFSSSILTPPESNVGGYSTTDVMGQKKKRTNPSRERNAFLFGEVTGMGDDGLLGGVGVGEAGRRRNGSGNGVSADQIFGLQPIRRG
ncbi:uncharacterized protein C8A04DRAFT_34571 [Dichotomopilus funicola]|uniref:Rab-GAP TBC domain-containing protein n=1 Tax=Dichotomopilus funicola TaxID=1934379 RepID=A0AAN6V934_9PEZI|nr:hypothetical protein C8A04DRAFT_34571 [Dichotomopilus funicola]